jgi:GrpB-like predicted nucleotidyltransferase (UPF0157 family)
VISVVEYDPTWRTRFDLLRSTDATALAGVPVLAIEHVGSSAVEGLAAKPVIDIAIVVTVDHLESACRALERIGYQLLGELGIPQRWAFREPPGAPRTNTYVVVDGSLALRNHIGVFATCCAPRQRFAPTQRFAPSTRP